MSSIMSVIHRRGGCRWRKAADPP